MPILLFIALILNSYMASSKTLIIISGLKSIVTKDSKFFWAIIFVYFALVVGKVGNWMDGVCCLVVKCLLLSIVCKCGPRRCQMVYGMCLKIACVEKKDLQVEFRKFLVA